MKVKKATKKAYKATYVITATDDYILIGKVKRKVSQFKMMPTMESLTENIYS